MPFDYYESDVPRSFQTAPQKSQVMYRQELEERAQMLRRLGYPKEEVLTRLTTNLRWDWEKNTAPSFIPELEQNLPALVDKVFAR